MDADVGGEGQESVGNALGDVQAAGVFFVEVEAFPFAKGRGIRADIDKAVPDGSSDAAYEFHFTIRFLLEMHSAKGVYGGRAGDAGLNPSSIKSSISERILAIRADEIATLISAFLGIQQENSGQACGLDLHGLIAKRKNETTDAP